MHKPNRLIHALFAPFCFTLVMWAFFTIAQANGNSMTALGIKPLNIHSLQGVLLSVFAHANLRHIANNSVAVLLLGTALFFFYRKIAYKVFAINWAVSGLLLWLFGRSAVHIGASGLTYGLAFFLFFSGLLRTERPLKIVSLLVVFQYGGMVWGMMPQDNGISWDGHLLGAIGGFCIALAFRKTSLVTPPTTPTPMPGNQQSSFTQNVDIEYSYKQPSTNN